MSKNKQVKQNRRGAPDGNANNLRHGFYSRQYKGIIQHDLDGHKFTGLTDEITALRVFLRQTIELIGYPTNANHALDCLRSLAAGFYSLTRLVRTQHIISLTGDGTPSLLDRAIDEVLAEMEAEDTISPIPPPQNNSVEDLGEVAKPEGVMNEFEDNYDIDDSKCDSDNAY